MSNGIICDNCGSSLALKSNGDDEKGEIATWLSVGSHDGALRVDACTRSCAVALLADDSPLALALDERMEAIAEIVRAINGETDDPEGSEDEQ